VIFGNIKNNGAGKGRVSSARPGFVIAWAMWFNSTIYYGST